MPHRSPSAMRAPTIVNSAKAAVPFVSVETRAAAGRSAVLVKEGPPEKPHAPAHTGPGPSRQQLNEATSEWLECPLLHGGLGVRQMRSGEVFGRFDMAAGSIRQLAFDRALVPEPRAHFV